MHPHFTRPAFFQTACLLGFLAASFAASAAGKVQTPEVTKTAFRLFVAPQTIRSGEVTLMWDKVDEVGATLAYQVFCDNKLLATTSKTHFTAKGLKARREYGFSVKAQKASGDVVHVSNPVNVKTTRNENVVSIEKFGALGDGKTVNTRAIQSAIDACPKNGVVQIPKGVFVSGALFLKSDMTLHIAVDGVLKGSGSLEDYEPFIQNRFEGWELKTYASLLNAGKLDHAGPANVRNLSIRGEGKISGGGTPLAKAMIAANGMRSRGRLICLMNCASVEIQGVTLEEPPSWTLHYIYCEEVTCHDLTIHTEVRNGDGIDPDSSKNSYIFNCSFDTGDDCIAIKSGKNPEGNQINRPTENVRIVDCRFLRGHGISIGSEMSGGIRDVLVQDCIAGNLLHGFQIKATKDRGGFVEGVVVRDCDLQKISILTALNYNNDGQPAPEPPYFRNFRFVNVDLSKAEPSSTAIIVNGFLAEGHRTRGVAFENVKLPRGAIVKVDDAEDVTFSNVVIDDGQKPEFKVTRSERISF